jgi:hypothetical protein
LITQTVGAGRRKASISDGSSKLAGGIDGIQKLLSDVKHAMPFLDDESVFPPTISSSTEDSKDSTPQRPTLRASVDVSRAFGAGRRKMTISDGSSNLARDIGGIQKLLSDDKHTLPFLANESVFSPTVSSSTDDSKDSMPQRPTRRASVDVSRASPGMYSNATPNSEHESRHRKR